MNSNNFFWFASILARIIPAASVMFVVTRLYSPNDFGAFQTLLSTTAIFIPFINFKLSFILAKLKRNFIVRRLSATAIIFFFISALLLSIPAYFFLSSTELNFNYFFLLLILLLWSIFEFQINILSILGYFKESSVGLLVQSSLTESSKFCFGLNYPTLSTLLGSWVFGYGVAVVYMSKVTSNTKIIFSKRNIFSILILLRRYWKATLSLMLSSAVISVNSRALVLIAAIIYNPGDVGLISIALLLTNFPADIIIQPLSKLTFSNLRALIKSGNSEDATYQIIKIGLISFCIGLAMLASFQIIIPLVFPIIFTESWIGSLQYVLILSFLIPCHFLSSSVLNCFSLFEKENYIFIYNLLVLIMYFLIFLSLSLSMLNLIGSMWVLAITQSILRIALYLSLIIVSKNYTKEILV